MSESGDKEPARPRQVTWAAWMIMLGSVFVVVTAYEVIAQMRSLESREAIERFLSEPPGDGLGLSVESVLRALHASAMVAAGCATASAVLGFYVLRRHRGARVGLSVLAVPLFLSGVVTGGFMSSLVAVAAAMLWLQPARDWFDGKTPAKPERDLRPAVWPPSPADQPVGPPAPRPHDGFGQVPATPVSAAPALDWPEPPGPAPAVRRRPDVLVVAAIVTWVFAGVVLLSAVVGLAVVATSPAALLDEVAAQNPELASQGVTESTILASTYLMGGVALVWSALACLCAALMLRRSAAAARALLVSASATAAFCLVGSLAALVLALPALASVVVIALVRRPESRAWLAGR